MSDVFIPELGDHVEATVPDIFRDERVIDAEIVRVFKNGKLRVADRYSDRKYTVDQQAVLVIAKAS